MEENNKKLKKDLEDCNIGNTRLAEKVAALEKKSGWLERTLSEEQVGYYIIYLKDSKIPIRNTFIENLDLH